MVIYCYQFEVVLFGFGYDCWFQFYVGYVDYEILCMLCVQVVDGGQYFVVVWYVDFYQFEIFFFGGLVCEFLFVLELWFFGLFDQEVDFYVIGCMGKY